MTIFRMKPIMNFLLNALICWLLAVVVSQPLLAQTKKQKTDNALSTIKEAELKRDLFSLSDDHFRGRQAGSLDELKASMWIAEQARAMGLKPVGDDGTFFQFFHFYQ